MYRKAVVLLLFCCVAGTVSIALSQEKSAPSPSPAPAPASAPDPVPSLSASPSDPEAVKPNSAVVSIPADGELYFGKVRVAEAGLPEKMKEALKDKPPDEQIVYIKAGVFVRYGSVVSVIDAMRAAGFDRIGLVADKKNPPDAKPDPHVKPDGLANNSSRSSNASLSAAPAVILIDVRSKTRLQAEFQTNVTVAITKPAAKVACWSN